MIGRGAGLDLLGLELPGELAETLLRLNGDDDRTCTRLARVIVWPGLIRPRLMIDGVDGDGALDVGHDRDRDRLGGGVVGDERDLVLEVAVGDAGLEGGGDLPVDLAVGRAGGLPGDRP